MLWPRELSKNTAVLAETREGPVWVGADVLSAREEALNSPRLLDFAKESRLSLSGDVLF